MLATAATKLPNNVSSQNRSINSKVARPIALSGGFDAPTQVDTRDAYLNTLRKATVEAIAAKKVAQRNYLNILAEADAWSKRLEIAQLNDYGANVRTMLLRSSALNNSARNLKALVDKHSVQVSTLKSQLNYWSNQLAS